KALSRAIEAIQCSLISYRYHAFGSGSLRFDCWQLDQFRRGFDSLYVAVISVVIPIHFGRNLSLIAELPAPCATHWRPCHFWYCVKTVHGHYFLDGFWYCRR